MVIKPFITSSALVLSRVFGIDEKLETELSRYQGHEVWYPAYLIP